MTSLCSVYLPHLTGEITAVIIAVLVVFVVLITVLVVVVWWRWQNVRCSAKVGLALSLPLSSLPQIQSVYKKWVHHIDEEQGLDIMIGEDIDKPTVMMLMKNLVPGPVGNALSSFLSRPYIPAPINPRYACAEKGYLSVRINFVRTFSLEPWLCMCNGRSAQHERVWSGVIVEQHFHGDGLKSHTAITLGVH